MRPSLVMAAALLLSCGGDPYPDAPPSSCLDWQAPAAEALPSSNALGCSPPWLFGHRGTYKHWAPENTLPAFQCALDQGATGVEIDLQMTSDGVIVAMHDTTPNRTTDASGAPAISEMTWDEVSELDAGGRFHPAFAGTPVPRLDEVLDLVEAQEGLMLFDVKDATLVPPLIEALEGRGLISRSLLSAHSLATLQAASDANPSLSLLYYIPDLDQAAALDLPGLAYLRVPKSVVDAPDSVDIINAAGYGAATGEFRVDYRYAIGLVDDMDAVWERVRAKVPEGCL